MSRAEHRPTLRRSTARRGRSKILRKLAEPPALPAKADGPTVEIPSSIDHSCNTDVTAALNDVFTSATDNSTIRFQQGGCYRVDGSLMLTIDSHHRLDIEGNGATIRTGTVGERMRKDIIITASDDIIVRDLVIVGSNEKAGATAEAYNPDLAFQHAFALEGVRRLLLEHVGASRLHGDFVRIGGDMGTPSSDVTVATSNFDGSGRQGISITNAERVLIVDNHITNVARSLFDLEPNGKPDVVRAIRITGNHTGPATNFWVADKGAGATVGAIEIDGNTMEQATGGLVFAFPPPNSRRGPWLVRGNQLIASNAVT